MAVCNELGDWETGRLGSQSPILGDWVAIAGDWVPKDVLFGSFSANWEPALGDWEPTLGDWVPGLGDWETGRLGSRFAGGACGRGDASTLARPRISSTG